MDKIENPGAGGAAHGVPDNVLVDVSDNNSTVETGQEREPLSRQELICRHTPACLHSSNSPWEECDISEYDIVPDIARTDTGVGSVEMREALFCALVYIAESIICGPPYNVENTIKSRYKQLLVGYYPDGWGNRINIETVDWLIGKTIDGGKRNGYL